MFGGRNAQHSVRFLDVTCTSTQLLVLPSGHERETVFFHLIEIFFGVDTAEYKVPGVRVGGEELKEGARRVQGWGHGDPEQANASERENKGVGRDSFTGLSRGAPGNESKPGSRG